jgi:hypothetical protein
MAHDIKTLSREALVQYVTSRATRIAERTPMEDDAAWDDTEDWLVDAAELAHAVMQLVARGGL